MTFEQKAAEKIGPGGYKCVCCGPKPKDRPKWRRLVRRRIRQRDAKMFNEVVQDMSKNDI